MGRFVDALTALEYRNEKLAERVVCELLFLPGFDRVENFKGLCFVYLLVIYAKQVS